MFRLWAFFHRPLNRNLSATNTNYGTTVCKTGDIHPLLSLETGRSHPRFGKSHAAQGRVRAAIRRRGRPPSSSASFDATFTAHR